MTRINPNTKKNEEYDLSSNTQKNEKEYILEKTAKDNQDVNTNTPLAKMVNAILNNNTTTTKQSLETPGVARVVILEILNSNPNSFYNRKELLEEAGKNYPHGNQPHPKYPNKKTWEVLTDWAISNLSTKKKIENRGGRYGISLNPAINSAVQSSTPTSSTQGVTNIQPKIRPKAPRKSRSKTTTINQTDEEEVEPKEEVEVETPVEPIENKIEPYKLIREPIIQEELPEDLRPPIHKGNYYAEKDLQQILASKLKNKNAPIEILVGPPGVAKTMGTEVFADKYNIPFVKIQAGPGITESELIGKEILKGRDANGMPQTEFELGAIPKAIEAANNYGTALLLIDELNVLKPSYMKYLNSIRGHTKEIRYGQKVWAVKPDKNLIVIATMNPSNFAGTNMLNTELKGGSSATFISYPSQEVEEQILADIINDKDLIEKLMLLASFTREKSKNDNDWYAISPRDEVFTLEDYKGFLESGIDPKEALKKSLLRFIVNKYMDNPDDYDKAEAVAAKIEDIFGINVKPGTIGG